MEPTPEGLAREVGRLQQALESLLQRHEEVEAENEELRGLFELQLIRTIEATRAWQQETNKARTHPDLGKLLAWLLAKAKVADEAMKLHSSGRLNVLTPEVAADFWTAVREYRELTQEQSE